MAQVVLEQDNSFGSKGCEMFYNIYYWFSRVPTPTWRGRGRSDGLHHRAAWYASSEANRPGEAVEELHQQ